MQNKSSHTKILAKATLLFLFYYIFSGLINVVISLILENFIGVKFESLTPVFTTLVIFILLFIFYRKRLDYLCQNVNGVKIKYIVLIIFIGILYGVFVDSIYMLPHIVGELNFSDINNIHNSNLNLYYKLAYAVNLVVLVPIVEEIIFRGIMFKKLNTLSPFWIILFSSFLFSLVHINPFNIRGSILQVVSALIFGIIAGIIYNKTHNILTVIIFHASGNLISYLILANQSTYFNVQQTLNYGLLYWLIIISSLIACAYLIKLFIIIWSKDKRGNVPNRELSK